MVVVAHVVTALVMGVAELGELAALLDAMLCTAVLSAWKMIFAVRFLFVTARGAASVGAGVSLAELAGQDGWVGAFCCRAYAAGTAREGGHEMEI